MNVNLKYCTIAAIIAVVLFSVTIGLLMNSGQASYTQSSETWYWQSGINVTYILVSGTWAIAADASVEERQYLSIDGEGTVLIPIYAVNPNPTLVLKSMTAGGAGNLTFHTDGRLGFKQFANISLYSPATVANVITRVNTNLTRGYSMLNITSELNGTQNDQYLQAMWLE